MKTALKWLFPSNFAYILAQGKHKLVNFSKGHTLIKILMLDFLSLLIVVLENATRLSVQFRKGNNLIWAPSALRRNQEIPRSGLPRNLKCKNEKLTFDYTRNCPLRGQCPAPTGKGKTITMQIDQEPFSRKNYDV